jgi:hypothetical protein
MELRHIPRARERLIIVDMAGRFTNIFHAAYFPDLPIASQAEATHVMRGVWTGHLTNRPMSAYKIGLFIGMPRTTVLRKLAMLMRRGYVRKEGTVYHVTDETFYKGLAATDRVVDVIIDAGERLAALRSARLKQLSQRAIVSAFQADYADL